MKVWLLIFPEEEPYMGGVSARMATYAFENLDVLVHSSEYRRHNFDAIVMETDTKHIKQGIGGLLFPNVRSAQTMRLSEFYIKLSRIMGKHCNDSLRPLIFSKKRNRGK